MGRIRAWLKNDQEYLIIDPFISTFNNLDSHKGLLEVYPRLNEKVNFICGFAEHLPLSSSSFDHVHMRSVIDHIYNPELAVAEAYRVLRAGGTLVIASFLLGGKDGRLNYKEIIKSKLIYFGRLSELITKDFHLWHPTYKEIISLMENSNFKIEKVHWLKGIKDVCYIVARK